ncbi:MAG TPA: hypothetical protein VGM68_07855 [Rhizomicrobium sp.]|jgi:hypothetical protein
MTSGQQGASLRQREPGTWWFRAGLFVVGGALLVWLVTAFLNTWLYPRDWILTVHDPKEKTGFSRAFQTQQECEKVMRMWHGEADRARREGKPEAAPTATCAKI